MKIKCIKKFNLHNKYVRFINLTLNLIPISFTFLLSPNFSENTDNVINNEKQMNNLFKKESNIRKELSVSENKNKYIIELEINLNLVLIEVGSKLPYLTEKDLEEKHKEVANYVMKIEKVRSSSIKYRINQYNKKLQKEKRIHDDFKYFLEEFGKAIAKAKSEKNIKNQSQTQ